MSVKTAVIDYVKANKKTLIQKSIIIAGTTAGLFVIEQALNRDLEKTWAEVNEDIEEALNESDDTKTDTDDTTTED